MDFIKTYLGEKLPTGQLLTSIHAGWDCLRAHPVGVGVATVGLYGLWYCYRPRNMPPGPWGYPLVGSLFSLGAEEHLDMLALSRKYGDVFTLWFGGNSYLVMLNSYDAVKEAFVARGITYGHRNNPDAEILNGARDELFASEYPVAKVARKKVIGAFRKSGMTGGRWNDTMATEFDELIERLRRVEGQTVNILDFITVAFAKHHCNIIFGKRELPNDPDNRLYAGYVRQWLDIFVDSMNLLKLPYPLRYIMNMVVQRRTLAVIQPVLTIFKRELDEHIESFDAGNIRDIIDIYLADGELERVGRDQLAVNMLSLLPDATNNVGAIFIWMIVYLIRYPEYQDKLYNEVQNAVHADGHVHLEDKNNLPLTKGFLDEVLRLTSPFPVSLGVIALEDTTFRGYNIPKRTLIRANLHALNFDPERFNDPEKFLPERYVNIPKDTTYESMAPSLFSFGRRSCIGEQLSRAVMFYFLANFVLKLRVDLAPGETLPDIQEYPWRISRVSGPFKVITKERA